MEVNLNKQEVTEAIKQYVSNRLNHEVAEIVDEFVLPSRVTVVLADTKSPTLSISTKDWGLTTSEDFSGTFNSNVANMVCNLGDLNAGHGQVTEGKKAFAPYDPDQE